MGAVLQGEVIRFDHVKGYGFISPNGGGEDVFLHVNDLLDDKHLIRPGATVEFVVESGERGLKASSVQLVLPPRTPATEPVAGPATSAPAPVRSAAATVASAAPADDILAAKADDDLVDVVPEADLAAELTETLLRLEPSLSGAQILAVRAAVVALGRRYGWIAD